MCPRHYQQDYRRRWLAEKRRTCARCGVAISSQSFYCHTCACLRREHGDDIPPEYVVEDRGFSTPCWIWQRSRNRPGYGLVRIPGHTYPAHKLYYERSRGPVPPGLQIDHLCRNPSCVNPDHLEAVTPAENSRRRPTSKLTAARVEEIRSLAGTMSQREIGLLFGVTQTTVSDILNGRTWRSG